MHYTLRSCFFGSVFTNSFSCYTLEILIFPRDFNNESFAILNFKTHPRGISAWVQCACPAALHNLRGGSELSEHTSAGACVYYWLSTRSNKSKQSSILQRGVYVCIELTHKILNVGLYANNISLDAKCTTKAAAEQIMLLLRTDWANKCILTD